MVSRFLKILFFIALFFTLGKDVFAYEVFPARLKVLIVPGHDNENSGAKYGNMKEADMNLELATKVYNQLKEDGRIAVSYTHLTLPTNRECRSRWSPYH